MRTVVVIQARMSSTRLPGKVMLPLDGIPVLTRLLRRLRPSQSTDEIVVATTDQRPDDIIEYVSKQEGVSIYRGSETDVLGRLRNAAEMVDGDILVRICADSPFVSYRLVDCCVEKLRAGDHDYVSNKIERTFPLGYDAEVFTMESFREVDKHSNREHEREHVTVSYREHPEKFSQENVASEELLSGDDAQRRTDLRITLDEANDYRLIDEVYTGIQVEDYLTLEDAISYIDEKNLAGINRDVEQKSMYSSEE